MDLLKKYGVYTVRKGTRLYRQSVDTEHHEVMFFGFCKNSTLGASYESDVQIWETIADFEALFMIKGKNRAEHLLSAIVEIYNYYFPKSKRNELHYTAIKTSEEERNILIPNFAVHS